MPILSPPALDTLALLLLAHCLADFVAPTDWAARETGRLRWFLLHGVIVGLFTVLMLGGAWQIALMIAIGHLVVDAVCHWPLPDRIRQSVPAFLVNQAVILAGLATVAVLAPDLAEEGLWAGATGYITAPAFVLAGFSLTVLAGGQVVGRLTAPYAREFSAGGLPNAGKIIGQLERALIFLFVLIGQPTGIGFLIAAKSFLRFEATKEQKASEYVIIGTLTSFGWALAISSATRALVDLANASPPPS